MTSVISYAEGVKLQSPGSPAQRRTLGRYELIYLPQRGCTEIDSEDV